MRAEDSGTPSLSGTLGLTWEPLFATAVDLAIYDARGHLVAHLRSGEREAAGRARGQRREGADLLVGVGDVDVVGDERVAADLAGEAQRLALAILVGDERLAAGQRDRGVRADVGAGRLDAAAVGAGVVGRGLVGHAVDHVVGRVAADGGALIWDALDKTKSPPTTLVIRAAP